MRLLTASIESFERGLPARQRFFSTKEGWENAALVGFQITEKIQALLDAIARAAPAYANVGTPRKELSFTLVQNRENRIWPYRKEEALERCLVASNSSLFNQFSVGKGKEAADLAVFDDEGCATLIELKPWTSSNSPHYAFVETMKNLFLYRSGTGNSRPEVMILAPQTYYDFYFSGSAIRSFREVMGNVALWFGTRVSLRSLSLREHDFGDRLRATTHDLPWTPVGTTRQFCAKAEGGAIAMGELRIESWGFPGSIDGQD